ncbi:hypothetical protein HPB50_004920 [Hyalomma asiaticum]|uniref:Uncharacterized protein n=1 Tax=Hyalomma asiaticum TaxID=266040 RepID=A0ACB7S0C1_HYAAI|nr:hypothetical protein HPB50_004920 [Hyalomma asiaticum]
MLQWSVQSQWTRMMVDEIRRRQFSTPAMNLVANSYAVCVRGTKGPAGDNRKAFKQLLENLGIPWPEKPAKAVDKLDVLFKLSVKWDIHLWFTVKLLHGKTAAGGSLLYIGPSRYTFFWSNLYNDISSYVMRRYVGAYMKYFSLGDVKANQKVDHFLVFNVTKYIVSKLAGLCNRRSAKFTMDSLAKRIGVSMDHWISVANKYFQFNESFLPNDTVVVRPAGIIDAARHFSSMYGPSLIQSHLGWWVLQIFAPIISSDFFLLKYGSKSVADQSRPIFCQIHTEQSYKLLVLANHIALHFPPSVRQSVDMVLQNVREQAASFFETSTESSEKYKLVAQKLRDVKIDLWPKPEYLNKTVLERIYDRPKMYNISTLEFWISERKARFNLTGSDAYFESTRLANSFSDELFVYDNVLNRVTLSMAAVHAPFYYNDMNAAVNYGGLGAAFLKTVLQGMDIDEQALDRDNTSSQHEEGVRDSCADNLNISRVSFMSALRAFSTIKHGGKFANVSHYPPEAFFFVSYCHTQSRMNPSFDCNKELRGVERFRRAFRCGRDSGMFA